MFWGKTNKSLEDKQTDSKLSVYTIPKEFYGGANPVIKFRNVEKSFDALPTQPSVQVSTIKVAPQISKISVPMAISAKTAVGFFGNWKLMALLAGGLFVLFLGGAGFYYWRTMNPVAKITKTASVIKTNPSPIVIPVDVPTTTPAIISTSTDLEPVVTSTTTQAIDGGALDFPSILLGSGPDLDRDGLSDTEEELFNTDPGKADTDGDGYEDGTEVYYLYSPSVVAPTRLISTDVVKEFTNPAYNYKLYYPSTWALGNVDSGYRDMLFSTITGENIEVRVFDKKISESFESWFSTWAKGEQLGSLKDFSTVFKGSSRVRTDNLVYYFEDQEKIYVIIYHVIGSGSVNYRDVITMMARSFRLPSESEAILPDQKIIRDIVPSTTSSLVP